MITVYGVKKNGKYLMEYKNRRAHWVFALDAAWMTGDKEMAKGFAKLTKGTAIEITLTEKPVEPEVPA